jgi:hypothetical protein
MLYACNAISLPMEGSFPIRYYPATVVFVVVDPPSLMFLIKFLLLNQRNS